VVIAIVWIVLCFIISFWWGRRTKKAWLGFVGYLVSFFLSPLVGWIVGFFLEPKKFCPYCKEIIGRWTKICRYCGKEVQ